MYVCMYVCMRVCTYVCVCVCVCVRTCVCICMYIRTYAEASEDASNWGVGCGWRGAVTNYEVISRSENGPLIYEINFHLFWSR